MTFASTNAAVSVPVAPAEPALPIFTYQVWGWVDGGADTMTGNLKFAEATDAYQELRDDGLDAWVFRFDPPRNKQAGMMTDVTADAEQRLRHVLGYPTEWPHWLEGAECPACERQVCICDDGREAA